LKVKTAFFFLGALALLLALALEAGSALLLGAFKPTAGVANIAAPGVGIRALTFIDVVLAYTLLLIGIDAIGGIRAIVSRVQGVVTLVLSIIGIIVAIVFIFASIGLVVLMLALLMSPPFGTIAYFVVWGTFDTASARLILGLDMTLKLVGVGMIAVSNPAFLKNKGFLLLMACSLGATFVLGLLQTIPPTFLVSITDAVGAIISGVIALVWMIILLVGAVLAIIRAVRSVVPA
jgi:hypothetical protein